ncbi:MAG: hypothetical protein IT285_03715 [Bdellovibrionales bacterium]|nr:hypothetical protein [Bdellovibrionales bacterium]
MGQTSIAFKMVVALLGPVVGMGIQYNSTRLAYAKYFDGFRERGVIVERVPTSSQYTIKVKLASRPVPQDVLLATYEWNKLAVGASVEVVQPRSGGTHWVTARGTFPFLMELLLTLLLPGIAMALLAVFEKRRAEA